LLFNFKKVYSWAVSSQSSALKFNKKVKVSIMMNLIKIWIFN